MSLIFIVRYIIFIVSSNLLLLLMQVKLNKLVLFNLFFLFKLGGHLNCGLDVCLYLMFKIRLLIQQRKPRPSRKEKALLTRYFTLLLSLGDLCNYIQLDRPIDDVTAWCDSHTLIRVRGPSKSSKPLFIYLFIYLFI